jgi:transcriptional regulator with XRE-family HTH domain
MYSMSQTTPTTGHKVSFHEQVAANIRAEMAAQRKTAVDLAEAIHTGHRAAIRRWNGTQEISLNEVDVIARWLGVTRSSLMAAREVADERQLQEAS